MKTQTKKRIIGPLFRPLLVFLMIASTSLSTFADDGRTILEVELNESILERIVDHVLTSLGSTDSKLDLSKILRKVGPKGGVYLPETSRLLPDNGKAAILGYNDEYSLYLTNLKLKLDIQRLIREKKIQVACKKTGECEAKVDIGADISFDLSKGKKGDKPQDFVRFSKKPYEVSLTPKLTFSFNLKNAISTEGVIDFNNKERPFNLTENIEKIFSVNFKRSNINFSPEDKRKIGELTYQILSSENANILSRAASYSPQITNSISSAIEKNVGSSLVLLVGELLTEKLVPYIDDELNLAYVNFTKMSYEKSPYLHVPFSNRGINLSAQETLDSPKIREQVNQLKDDFSVIDSELLFLKSQKLSPLQPQFQEVQREGQELQKRLGTPVWYQVARLSKMAAKVIEGDQETISNLEAATMRKLSFKHQYGLNESMIRMIKGPHFNLSSDKTIELRKNGKLVEKVENQFKEDNLTEGDLKKLQRRIKYLKAKRKSLLAIYQDPQFKGLLIAKNYLTHSKIHNMGMEQSLTHMVGEKNARLFLNMIPTFEKYLPSRKTISDIETLKLEFLSNLGQSEKLKPYIRNLLLSNDGKISDALWFLYNVKRFKENPEGLNEYTKARARTIIIKQNAEIKEIENMRRSMEQNRYIELQTYVNASLRKLSKVELIRKEYYLNEILEWVKSHPRNVDIGNPPMTYLDIFDVSFSINEDVRKEAIAMMVESVAESVTSIEKKKIMSFLIDQDISVSPELILKLQDIKDDEKKKEEAIDEIGEAFLHKVDDYSPQVKSTFGRYLRVKVKSRQDHEIRLKNPQQSSLESVPQFEIVIARAISKIDSITTYLRNSKTTWSKDQVDELIESSFKIDEAIYYLNATKDQKESAREIQNRMAKMSEGLKWEFIELRNLNKEKISLQNRGESREKFDEVNKKIANLKSKIDQIKRNIEKEHQLLKEIYENFLGQNLSRIPKKQRKIVNRNKVLKGKLFELRKKIEEGIKDEKENESIKQLKFLLRLNGPKINTEMSLQHCSGKRNLPQLHIIHPRDEKYDLENYARHASKKQKGQISAKIHLEAFNQLIQDQLLGKTICINKNSQRTCDNAKMGDVLIKINFPGDKEKMPKVLFKNDSFALNFTDLNIQVVAKSGIGALDYLIGKPIDFRANAGIKLTPTFKDIKGDGVRHLFLNPQIELNEVHGNNRISNITSKVFTKRILGGLEHFANNSAFDLTPSILSPYLKLNAPLEGVKLLNEMEIPSKITDNINIDFRAFTFDPDSNQFNVQFDF